mgnify:CR=1 FL=1
MQLSDVAPNTNQFFDSGGDVMTSISEHKYILAYNMDIMVKPYLARPVPHSRRPLTTFLTKLCHLHGSPVNSVICP